MAVVIRLTRCGKNNRPYFRIVAADRRYSCKGKFLELLGYYDPKGGERKFSLKKDRLDKWVQAGAECSEAVKRVIRICAKSGGLEGVSSQANSVTG